jgi:xylose isomerase
VFARKMQDSGVKLLWGTANLFSHRRYMAGAATNPDPEVFAYAAAQVKNVLELTHELGGANYVLWGGREGYETLLNTDLKRELDQLGRFMQLVVEHKHKIGFKGTILIEPKPGEPTKHQYDYDVATVHGFLRSYGLEHEIRINIEQNHALLAGHTFEHEIALAQALGVFGSIDMNRGDELLGWDTDQFPNNLPQVALALYHILRGGGLVTGGLNFDAKLRRQSIDPDDLVAAHAGAMDLCARALLVAEKMIEDGALADQLRQRYGSWEASWAKASSPASIRSMTWPPWSTRTPSNPNRARAARKSSKRWSTATSEEAREYDNTDSSPALIVHPGESRPADAWRERSTDRSITQRARTNKETT